MMTKKEAQDLAFERTMEYIISIRTNIDNETKSLIARAIGNYETQLIKLQNEINHNPLQKGESR